MNSRPNSTSRLFLILALACAIFVSGTEMQARQRDTGGRLIVQRAANFGTYYIVRVSIDGRTVANIPRGQRYDGFVSGGDHMLTISSFPNPEFRWPASLRLIVQPGRTYVFTAAWEADRLVLH
jgi:hypothetical protein